MMRTLQAAWLLTLSLFVCPASAANTISDGWEWLKQDVSQTWQEPQYYDLYLPFISWHARFAYDKDKTDNYNETPWGGGLGVSRINEDGNWSALYAMAFKDSHNEWQPIIGYGWEKGWYLDQSRDFRLGLGLTAGITARDDFANYVPLPIVLPLFSAGYKRFNVQFTYIPGTYNNGNVLFAWVRYAF
ncbi:palmitoyl transferase [Pantoea sp. SORGH_AS 659]|jgi:palmitoyl transferase|nr:MULTISPECIES: lipid IV(A) palmitoyltransferase PagP [Pantoea]MBD9659939.1 lipid IV(A) palmitoyltransferase PagP [Pantoea sp. PNT03]MDR6352622.1 palmitoyl transferase [Pantoea sp. SORGH_AS_0659]